MSSERLYFFTVNGKLEMMTIQDARAMKSDEVNRRIEEIINNSKSKRMNKDGFEAGWQANINEYVGSRGEYDRRIKELGLVEQGYDYIAKDTTTSGGQCASLDFALHAKELGVELNDQEIDAIASGEYFSPDKCDLGDD